MNLLTREKDKLLITVAADLAKKRMAKGLKLNYPEAMAIISDYILEGAREGKSVAVLMQEGKNILKRSQVMDGVPEMIAIVQIEATFKTGTKLVTIYDPVQG